MNMADETHYRMLQSLYKGLAGGDLDCPLPSNNWVEIGFQGSDPIRDLRGCGMLSIFATLSFLHTHKDVRLGCVLWAVCAVRTHGCSRGCWLAPRSFH